MKLGRKVTLSGNFEKSGFLFLCIKEAEHLGLTGRVRLTSVYMVEVEVFGPLKNIEIFLNWSLYSLKPLEVQILKVEEVPFEEYNSFELS